MNQQKPPLPAKVSKKKLREHFKTVYKLGDDQVGLMLESSARSLNLSFSALYKALEGSKDLGEVSRIGHSIKGLLLNMGELQWAELARELELSAASEKERDYRAMVKNIQDGVKEIL